MPCYPINQQVAEKAHAYTRPHVTGEGTRVKDLVDLLLLAGLETATVNGLRQALDITFAMRTTHPLPRQLPPPPANWRLPFRRLSREVQLPWSELDEAYTWVWFVVIAGNFGRTQYSSGPSRPKDEQVQSESPCIL